ncbi:MAG: hypothetical protein Q9193_002374 [Seirophora villosa]
MAATASCIAPSSRNVSGSQPKYAASGTVNISMFGLASIAQLTIPSRRHRPNRNPRLSPCAADLMSLQPYVDSEQRPLLYTALQFRQLVNTCTITGKVLVITADGRTLTGILLSCDQLTNLVLSQTIERIIRPPGDPEPSAEVSHGLYLIRGENVVICGLVDEELDEQIEWTHVRGSVVSGIKHV